MVDKVGVGRTKVRNDLVMKQTQIYLITEIIKLNWAIAWVWSR